MFKDSHVTRLDAWSVVEEADAMPAVAFPAFVGTGKLGIALDAAGLQSLPNRLGEYYHSPAKPWHVTQSDTYVLREGMISAHLWEDEARHTGVSLDAPELTEHVKRNFLPMGFLEQSLEVDGKCFAGEEIIAQACNWRRDWDLRHATVCTAYSLDHSPALDPARACRLAVEVFAPHGGETVYVKLTRGAGRAVDAEMSWQVSLSLQTRHGLPLFDQPGAVTVGAQTLLATIDGASQFCPAEPYAVVYGVAADGAEVALSTTGWQVTLRGRQGEAQTAWLRLDFRRFAGEELPAASGCRDGLEATLRAFTRAEYTDALQAHRAEYAAFWARTADIEVEQPDAFEVRRRFMLHMSEYLLRTGNDHTLGGTVQFLFVHQNGWQACNFHDHHYIIDGIARVNLWEEAEGHARWMKRVMNPTGRPFPWMMTYDGFATIPPARDRAPMSDANRALLAMRLYELAGVGREALLRDTIYPILRTVADHGVAEWFYEEDGQMRFRAVENDVMAETPRVSEAGTIVMYLTVLRKAIAYSERLGVDADRRAGWQRVVDRTRLDVVEGRYRAWLDAPATQGASVWFENAYGLTEAQEYLDDATYRRTRDFGQRVVICNYPWLNASAACSEMRLGRPDRAEQFLVDSLQHRIHGPGYFEECAPIGQYALPPFATAHGAHLAASCEQIVLPDFWRARVLIGASMPSKLRASHLRFSSLRTLGGMLISGSSDPKQLTVEIHHTGDPLEVDIQLRLPCEAGLYFQVLRDGQPVDHTFAGDNVTVHLSLTTGEQTTLAVQG